MERDYDLDETADSGVSTIVNRPLCNTGHRGTASYSHKDATTVTENTMSAFLYAYEKGALSIEIDVYQTSDDKVVIHHDGTASRIIGQNVSMTGSTLAQIQALPLQSGTSAWNLQAWDDHIPSLEELFQLISGQPVPTFDITGESKYKNADGYLQVAGGMDYIIDIEVKDGRGSIVPLIKALTEKYGLEDRVVVSSFNRSIWQAMEEYWPEQSSGIIHGYDTSVDTIKELAPHVWTNNCSSHLSAYNMPAAQVELVRQGQARGITFWGWCIHKPTGGRLTGGQSIADDYVLAGFNGYTLDSNDWVADEYIYSIVQEDVVLNAEGYAAVEPVVKMLRDVHTNGTEGNPAIDVFEITENGLVKVEKASNGLYALTAGASYITRYRGSLVMEGNGDYYTYSNTFSVSPYTVNVTGVELNQGTADLILGDTEKDTVQLIATITPENATNKDITWSSSAESVAVVDNGKVTAVAKGTAVITVTTANGGFTASCTVNVSDPLGDQIAADEAAAAAVNDMINAIGEVTLEKEEEIKAARAAYENLTDTQKLMVKDHGKLVAAEEKLAELKGENKKPVWTWPIYIGGAVTAEPEFSFVDVPETAWYYDEVKSAWENDLIDGKNEYYYMPDDTLTVAEAIKLAAALHQLYYEGQVLLTNGSPNWYDTYVDYAVSNGIIEEKYDAYTLSQMNAAISRNEFVHIFFGALPVSAYYPCNHVADNAIPDVKLGNAFAGEIYTFYRAGILTGNDEAGTFKPNSSIKRSEVAAILIRMYDTNARQTVTLN